MNTYAWIKDHSNWEQSTVISFPSLPRYGIERRTPRDGELSEPPPITESVIEKARQDAVEMINKLEQHHSRLEDEIETAIVESKINLYRQCLKDVSTMKEQLEIWFGKPHRIAEWAAPEIATLKEAMSILVNVTNIALTTDLYVVVIAPHSEGYCVKRGLGDRMKDIGIASTLEDAIHMAWQAVVAAREKLGTETLLKGWSPDTEIAPHLSLRDYTTSKIMIRRALSADLSDAWNLPTWAIVCGNSVKIVNRSIDNSDIDYAQAVSLSLKSLFHQPGIFRSS